MPTHRPSWCRRRGPDRKPPGPRPWGPDLRSAGWVAFTLFSAMVATWKIAELVIGRNVP
jgi:hypothetical protein